MKAKTATGTKSRGRCEDLFSAVRPRGWLLERLKNVSNPRKHRWNAYLRACAKIPKSSPLYGCTSWKKINERRGQLIEKYIRLREPKDAEYIALQKVASEAFCGGLVVQNFLLARVLRRLKAER